MVDFYKALAASKTPQSTNAIPNEPPPMPSNDPVPWRCVVCGEMHSPDDTKAMLILRTSSRVYVKWEVCQSCAPMMGKKLNDMANAIEERECRQR